VETLNKVATNGLKPAITIILNIPDRIFNERERLAEKILGVDRIESASSNFRKRVNKAYKILYKKTRGHKNKRHKLDRSYSN